MSSSAKLLAKNQPPTPKPVEPEERPLLNAQEEDLEEHNDYSEDIDPKSSTWSRRKITITAVAVIGLLLTGTLARTVLFSQSRPAKAQNTFSSEILSSNGTTQFKRTVLIVSIDGLRLVALVYRTFFAFLML